MIYLIITTLAYIIWKAACPPKKLSKKPKARPQVYTDGPRMEDPYKQNFYK